MKLSVPSPAPTLGDDVEEAVRSIAVELGYSREEMLRVILKEWLEQNAYLPVHELDEDGDTEGNA
ncbi:ribbon-helix-helix protein, CopG family [Agrobacterium tumefaciens]|nr:ribbon-helix-helix protein, CopG family [Agrobacterium tumefaciens]